MRVKSNVHDSVDTEDKIRQFKNDIQIILSKSINTFKIKRHQ